MRNAIRFSRLRCGTAVIAVTFVACSVVAYAGDTSSTARPDKEFPGSIERVPHTGFDVAAVQQAGIYEIGAGALGEVRAGPQCNMPPCPGGSDIEAELCDENWPDGINGGCNLSPPGFESITAGVTKCGTLKAVINTRDTDWYQLSVTDTDGDGFVHISTSVSAELPVVVFIFDTDPDGDGDCGTDATVVYGELFVDPTCVKQATGACVPVGAPNGTKTYTIFVSVGDCQGGIFDGYRCDTSNDYELTVTVDENCAVTGACCSTDGLAPTCTDVTLAACVGSFGGEGSNCAGTTCPPFADFCADALPLPLNGTVVTDNTSATPQVADPATEEGNDPELPTGSPSCQWAGAPAAPHNTIWFSYTADANGSVQIDMCDLSNCDLLADTAATFYSGACGSLTELWCAEDNCPGDPGGPPYYRSQLNAWFLTPGEEYKVAIYCTGSWGGSIPGELIIEVLTPNPLPPPVGGCCLTDGLGTYSCTDGINEADCDALGGRFKQEGTVGANDGCATMSPQCGEGACCSRFFGPPEYCSSPFDQANCEVAFDGIWQEGGTCNPSSFTEPCVGLCCGGTKCTAHDNETDCLNAGNTWTFGPTCLDDPEYCITACAADIGCQTVAYPTGGRTSDATAGAGFQVADNFQPTVNGNVTEVCWWGFYFDFDAGTDCVPASESWTITYYNDDAGGTIPGSMIVSHPVTPSKVATGYVVTGSLLVEYRYDATHPAVTVAANTCYWVEILNNTGEGSTCFWLWDNSTTNGDLMAAQTGVPGPYVIGDEIAEDLAFCLNVATDPNSCPTAPPTATGWVSVALHDPFDNEPQGDGPTDWDVVLTAGVRAGPPDPRTDKQIEPRYFNLPDPPGGTSTTQKVLRIVVDLDGPAIAAVTVDAVCTGPTPNHAATVTLSAADTVVTAVFDPPLPNTECCTMTLAGGATGSQVIKMLRGDVDGSGRVNSADKFKVGGKVTSRQPPLVGDDFFYDVNMSGRINSTDRNLVKASVTTSQNALNPACP